MKKIIMGVFGALALFLSNVEAKAADGLYATPPPPGSAFIRFINGDTVGTSAATLRGKEMHSTAAGEIGAYTALPAGDAPITFGSGKTSEKLESDKYYSVILHHGKASVLQDASLTNRLKAQIVLFNLTDMKDVSLKTADGKVAVIDSVAADKTGVREVNAVKVGFGVYSGSDKIADLEARPLERNATYAVVVYKGADGKTDASFDKSQMP